MAIDRNMTARPVPRFAVRGGIVGVVCFVVAGLAWSQASAERDDQAVPPEALASGNAGDEAYTTGFDNYRECLIEDGYTLIDVALSVDGLLYEWKVPGAAVETGRDESCYNEHLYPSDVARQMLVSAMRGDAEAYAAAASACAARYDLTADPRDFDAVARELIAQDRSIAECLDEAARTTSGNADVSVLPTPEGGGHGG